MFNPKKESCLTSVAAAMKATLAADGAIRGSVLSDAEPRRNADIGLAERLVITSLMCDTVVVVYALIIAFVLRFRTHLIPFGIPSSVTLPQYACYIASGALSSVFLLAHLQLYDRHMLLRFR